MKRLPAFLIKKQQMKHKLFMYMLILVILILLMLFSGLTILGQFTGEKQKTFDTLDFQNDIFSRQIESHFDRLAAVGIRLSNDSSNAIEKCLDENGLEFSDINNSEKNVADIQKAIFGILEQKLFEADCSGAFIVLNATVNKNSNDAENSRTGLYLQRSSIDYSDNSVLLYRGLSDLAKQRGIMPHRKWRLEFKTDCFPDYADLISDSYSSLIDAYRISDIFTLSGTDERVVLVTVPIIGKDKAFYGLCGFEISENYFKHTFNQPSKLNHAVFAFNKGNKGDISNENSFSCGITGGYYLSPGGKFKASDFGDGLTLFSGKSNSYIGSTKQVNLCSNGSFALTAIIPKQDYDSLVLANILKIFMLSILIIAATIGCSYFFARKFFRQLRRF